MWRAPPIRSPGQSGSPRGVATWRRRARPPEPLPEGWSPDDGYRAGLKLADDPDVTAVFCANDEVALGLIRAMHEKGRRVPEDVSVVGFDGLPVAGYSCPPLTTVRQDFHRAGRTMVDLIAEQFDGGPRDGGRHVIIPTELVVRASTAPPGPGVI